MANVDRLLDLTDPADLELWDASVDPDETPLPLSAYRRAPGDAVRAAAPGPGHHYRHGWIRIDGAIDQLRDDDHAIHAAFDYKDGPTGLTVSVDSVRRQGTGHSSVYVSAYIRDANGEIVGGAEHTIRPADQRTAALDGLVLNPGIQGQGFAARYMAQVEDAYRAHGVEKLTGVANIDVGGYAWARSGWDFSDQSGRHDVAIRAREVGRKFSPEVQAEIRRVSDDPNSSAVEFAMIGWTPGASTWPGKQIMLGSNWGMVKQL